MATRDDRLLYLLDFCNAYDQVIHDVAIQNLPVIFCLDRAGLVANTTGCMISLIYDVF
jgi:hypothetical protein